MALQVRYKFKYIDTRGFKSQMSVNVRTDDPTLPTYDTWKNAKLSYFSLSASSTNSSNDLAVSWNFFTAWSRKAASLNKHVIQLCNSTRGAGMAQWWEHSPPTNVARVRFPDSASYVGWVCCWFSSLLWEVFLRVPRFSPLLKNQHF